MSVGDGKGFTGQLSGPGATHILHTDRKSAKQNV